MHVGPGHAWALCEAALQMGHDAPDKSYQHLVEVLVALRPRLFSASYTRPDRRLRTRGAGGR